MVRSIQRGFTLIELMVVMLITLVIMGLLTSFFVTTTKVVSVVELKLRLNEQARGILDSLEIQIICACANERGGQFAIKGVDFKDADPDPKVSNTTAASVRKMDMLNFVVKPTNSGMRIMSNYPLSGGYPFPMMVMHQESQYATHEYAVCALLSNIHYATIAMHAISGYSDFNNAFLSPAQMSANQNAANADVSQLCYSLQRRDFVPDARGPNSLVSSESPSDPVPHPLAPGYELGGPYLGQGYATGATFGIANVSKTRFMNAGTPVFEDVYVMDLSISVWDETDRKFHRVPRLDAVFFAPIPKAVLIGMTVCDINKKGRISFTRIITIPAGTGNGYFDPTVEDTGADARTLAMAILAKYPKETVNTGTNWILTAANDTNHNHKLDYDEVVLNYHSLPLPLNRRKQLRSEGAAGAWDLDPMFLDTSIFLKP